MLLVLSLITCSFFGNYLHSSCKTFKVRCGQSNFLMNSTSLTLVKGLNSVILKPFSVEREDCFVAVRTDSTATLYTLNTVSPSTGLDNTVQ